MHGSSGSGKSMLVECFLTGKTIENSSRKHERTMEDKTYRKEVMVTANHQMMLEIYDMYGDFDKLSKKISANHGEDSTCEYRYPSAAGVVLVYDVNDPNSLDNMQKVYADMRNRTVRYGERRLWPKDMPIVLIGNKTDVKSTEECTYLREGRTFARAVRIPLFETSTETGDDVKEAFEYLAQEYYKSIREAGEDEEKDDKEDKKSKKRKKRIDQDVYGNGDGTVFDESAGR